MKEEVEQKVRDMEAFFVATKETERRYRDLDWERQMAQTRSAPGREEMLALGKQQMEKERKRTFDRCSDYFELERLAAARAAGVDAAQPGAAADGAPPRR